MRSPAPTRQVLALVILFLAAGLLASAWPRLRASLQYLPVDTALSRHWAGESITAAQLQALAARAVQAHQTHPHYRYLDGLSVLRYLQGMDAETPPDARRLALESSIEAARESVSRAPMRPAAWLRIAAARASLGQPANEVVPALVMSVYTGRVEPTLLLLRLQLLYEWQRHMDADARRLLTDQTLLTWRVQPRQLIARIRAQSIPYAAIAGALAREHPAILDEIDEAIRGTVR